MNRDSVGANNIATIGITMALSTDGHPLPLFRLGYAKRTGNEICLICEATVDKKELKTSLKRSCTLIIIGGSLSQHWRTVNLNSSLSMTEFAADYGYDGRSSRRHCQRR